MENLITIPIGCIGFCDTACEAVIDTVLFPADWALVWVYYDPLGMNPKMDENGKIYLKCYEKMTHNPIVLEVKNFPSADMGLGNVLAFR